jgi:hypothetical protein
MATWKQRFWPTIKDELSARVAVRGAFKWSATWAFLGLALGLISLSSGTPIEQNDLGAGTARIVFDWVSIIDGAIYGLVAWKIRGMSRGWALTGLILATLGIVGGLSLAPSPIELIAQSLILLAFVNASRATRFYAQLQHHETLHMGDAEKLFRE